MTGERADDGAEPIAVVVGAAGGIGRALLDALTSSGDYRRVVALSRRRPDQWPDDAERIWACVDILDEATLRAAAAVIADAGAPTRIIVASGRLIEDDAERIWACVDILDEATLRAAAAVIADAGAPTRIIVASGRLGGAAAPPEKSIRALDADNLALLFATNAIGPALVAKHLLPLTPRDRPSLFAALSARVGSIGDNRLGGWYSYRASKAALNMIIRNLAIEQRRTRPLSICAALHPGTVQTALSAPFQAAVRPEKLFTPAYSAAALMGVMERLGPEDSGGFFAWDGAAIPW